MEKTKKLTFAERCAIMQPAMKQALELLVNAHESCQFEGGDGEGICVMQPTMSNGKKYYFKFCLLEDVSFKELKLAKKLDKPQQAMAAVKLDSAQLQDLNNNQE